MIDIIRRLLYYFNVSSNGRSSSSHQVSRNSSDSIQELREPIEVNNFVISDWDSDHKSFDFTELSYSVGQTAPEESDDDAEEAPIQSNISFGRDPRKISEDPLLKAGWDATNVDIQRIYQALGPPPLRTLSGVRDGR
jgi:hypothetical protein